jgi:integrase
MGLEMQKKKDGSLRSKWWYGRFTVNGKETFVNLDVEVKGNVPASLKARGDDAFEHSRMKAHVKLEGLIAEAISHKSAEQHLEKLYELKSGTNLTQVPIAEIEQVWLSLPTRRKRSALWEKNQCATLKTFRCHIQAKHPAIRYLSQITSKMVLEWLRGLENQKYSPATYNDKMHLLKRFFEKIGPEAGIMRNPFAGIPSKDCATIHHQPFTQEELNKILTHATGAIRSIFLVGMCTGMRLGDCCQVKWDDVDLQGGFLTVTTSKTGEVAEIPLFPILREEIERQRRVSKYIFTEAAALYQKHNCGISWRIRKVFTAADIETKQECPDRVQDATLKGFHSLRTTWITMALSAGVPMELVRRVTGHSTVEVVLKHYFRPGKEAFKTALETAMPKMLTGGEDQKTEEEAQKPNENTQEMLQKIQGLLEYGKDMEKAAILRRLAEIEQEIATQLRQGQDGQNAEMAA